VAVLGGVVYWGHDDCVGGFIFDISGLAGGSDAAAVDAGAAAKFAVSEVGRYLKERSRDINSVRECELGACGERCF